MNETLETIHNLRSTRKFTDKEITKKDVEKILEATIRTANSGGRQVYSIIVVDDRELLDKHFYKANKAIVFCVDYNRWMDCANHMNHSLVVGDIRGYLIGSVDAIMASQTAVIAAKSLGIESLFTSSLNRTELKDVYEKLNLPEKYCFPLISLCLGYAKEEPTHMKGRVRKGVIHYKKYQRLTPEELDELISEYDDEKNHFSTQNKEELVKEGYKGYLDKYFSRWDGDFKKEEIIDCYDTLRKIGFFEYLNTL